MRRLLLTTAVLLLAAAGSAGAQNSGSGPSSGAAPGDSAAAWSAPEGTYVLQSEVMSVTVRIFRTDAGLAATLQKENDTHDPVTALSVAVTGPDLLIRFQPGPNVFKLTLRRHGAVVTALMEGDGRQMAFTGTRQG